MTSIISGNLNTEEVQNFRGDTFSQIRTKKGTNSVARSKKLSLADKNDSDS